MKDYIIIKLRRLKRKLKIHRGKLIELLRHSAHHIYLAALYSLVLIILLKLFS
jgi:hypothetical protein